MDINCTDKCVYQTEGKCTLDQLPAFFNVSGGDDTDCPYCNATGQASAGGISSGTLV